MAIAATYGKNALATYYGSIATYGAIYTTTPGSAAGTEGAGGSYARKPLTWSAPTAGVITASATFDVGASTIKGTGVHTAITAGNYIDGVANADVVFSGTDTVTVNFTYTQV